MKACSKAFSGFLDLLEQGAACSERSQSSLKRMWHGEF
jgi:hypothetical protein